MGSSFDIESRWKQHKYNLRSGRHHARRLQGAWNRHGPNAFQLIILERLDLPWFHPEPPNLIEREQFWIDRLLAYGNGYNGRPTASNQGKLPEQTKARMRAGSKRASADPALRQFRSQQAKQQHLEGRLGKACWTPESQARARQKMTAPGQSERQSALAKTVISRPGHLEKMLAGQRAYWAARRGQL